MVAPWDGRSGRPRSANAASSFHLFWEVPRRAWQRAEAVLEVVEAPTVDDLHFWALQVSFAGRGAFVGAGHLGLQWYARHPRHRAVNWGGYADRAGELAGSVSLLPSATGNPNTRDFAWEPGRSYRLVVDRAEPRSMDDATAWRASVLDEHSGETTVVRDLWCPGAHLDRPMVWSEVFAPCDAPGSAVRWSGLRLIDDVDEAFDVRRVRVNYQSTSEGGCTTTDVSTDGDGIVQRTGTTRLTRQGATLNLAS